MSEVPKTETPQQAPETKPEIQYSAQLRQAIDQIKLEAQQLKDQKHERLISLLAVLDQARLRQLANVEIRYQLAIQHAKETLKFTQNQIDIDTQDGQLDCKEAVYADLRKRKKDIKEVMDRDQSKGQLSTQEQNLFNDIRIPNKKKEKKAFRGNYNFKLPEAEARQDLQFIQQLAEELDSARK